MTPRDFAIHLARKRLRHLQNIADMRCEHDDFVHDFETLVNLIKEQRKDKLAEVRASSRPAVIRELHEEAAFLFGLELGKRITSI